MLGAQKQKAWLSDQAFAKKFGFEAVDEAPGGYQLLALAFDQLSGCPAPRFAPSAKQQAIEQQELTIYYDSQCPYTAVGVAAAEKVCREEGAALSLVAVDTLQKAKTLPGVFNNWAVFYHGKLATVNLLDAAQLRALLKK